MGQLDITRPVFAIKPWYTQIETVWNEVEAAVNDNADRIQFLEDKPARLIRVTFIDPVSTSLPSGPAVTIDDVTLENDDLVLFTNLNSGNNRVYKVSNLGDDAVWQAQELFGPGDNLDEDPIPGDMAVATKGVFFANQTAIFNDDEWKVNDVIRLFNGPNFWELGSIQSLTLTNFTTGEIFSVAAEGSEHMIVNFSIVRGAAHETGQLFITTDGISDATIAVAGAGTGSSGVQFQALISGSDLILEYSTDNTGSNGQMKYFVQRWSNVIGGPAGIPNYAGTGGNLLSAAGNTQEIQYNDNGDFAADSRFKWNPSLGALVLGTLEYHALSTEQSLLDDQTVPVAFASYSSSDYKHVIIEYSLERDGQTQTGVIKIANNASSASLVNDFASTDALGINFDAAINGSNVELRYTSTDTGFTSKLRYSLRRWTTNP